MLFSSLSISVLMSFSASAGAPGPTDGEVYRTLATDPVAFEDADLNGDGVISDDEFGRYKDRQRTAPVRSRRYRAGLGGHDLNNDSALTPYELYPEADYDLSTGGSRSPSSRVDDDAPYDD
ncbi:EF-hand domain-containing protein [Parvularcula sp. LCG005]|uniref:EF-hand domain-containing protein n=1 Tax=Parvularcula sp. LCG005 TaxID=3078805 RepID=UPI0029429017|nr:EF-hand domain-containing protein [Parvularcula sp. LCG005]WOI53716.1 EF-hand domain-containing protein [Parvularcula sp. LCG005]